MKKEIIYILMMLFLLQNCVNKSDSNDSLDEIEKSKNGTSGESNQSVSFEGNNFTAVVLFDGFRVRRAPGRKSEVLFAADVGTILNLTEKKSELVESISLRDILYEEPYLEVIIPGEHTNHGWIYGGGVLKLNHGNSSLQQQSELTNYVKFIDGISLDDESLGRKSFDYLKSNFNNPPEATTDALFIITDRYLTLQERKLWKVTESIPFSEEEMQQVYRNTFDMSSYPPTELLADSGFELQTSEGLVYPISNKILIQNKIPGKFSAPMEKYIELLDTEFHNPPISDAAIIVSTDELLSRALEWEKFENKYPGFVLEKKVIYYKKNNWRLLFAGSSNSPAVGYHDGKIVEDVIKSWKKAAAKYPSLSVGKIAKQLLEKYQGDTLIIPNEFFEYVQKVLEEG